MSTPKLLIVASSNIDKFDLANDLVLINEELSIAPIFTSDTLYSNNLSDGTLTYYYKDNENINLDYKNSALFFIVSTPEYSYGITVEDYYNNSICVLSILDFNAISDKNLKLLDNLIIWIDSKFNRHNIKEFKDSKFLLERIGKFEYLYFLDEDNKHIANTINTYITTSSLLLKSQIREENS